MKLFEPVVDVEHRPYCGPVAISALTGVPVSRAEHMLRRARRHWNKSTTKRNNYAVRGVFCSEVVKVLKLLGCKVEPVPKPEATFSRFVDDTKHMSTAFLVNVTGHFMAVCNGWYRDNGGSGEAASFHRPGWRIKRVWQVTAPTTPRYTLDDAIGTRTSRPKKPKPDIKQVRYRRVLDRIKTWERRQKRATTALKKLRLQKKYYESKVTVLPA